MGMALCRGVGNYFSELWSFRHFWMNLVRAELQRRYRRSILGLGWSMLQPICMTLVLGVVYRRVFQISFWEFAPMLLTGLAFWNMFSQTILRGCDSLVTSESYIRQQPLPLALFPLRIVLTSAFHFLISFLLTLLLVWPLRQMFAPLALLSLIPTFFLLFCFCWSLSIIAGFAHTFFPDTQHLAEVGLQALMFLTPIMYPASILEKSGVGWILHWNPLAVILEMLRQPVLTGEVPLFSTYAIATGLVALPCIVAGWMISRYEDRLIFAL
ncbi:MAG: ABC transporter permease [Gemmataceae bacterium]